MRSLYSILTYLIAPFIILRLLWRSRKAPAYRYRIAERFGFFDAEKLPPGGIWVHVVSVGETIAATPFIRLLQQQYPAKPLIITTMTSTGSQQVKTSFPENIFHVYVPYDLPCAVDQFLTKIQPSLAILMETELWPNILHQCQQRQIPTLLANARMSEKSTLSYQRFQPLVRQMLSNLTVIAAQSRADADRFIRLGAVEKQIQVVGNIKFDMEIPQTLRDNAKLLRQQLGQDRIIFIAASTHEGEDEAILDAFKILRAANANLMLVLVPRHAERFNKVAELAEKQGYRIMRRSQGAINADNTVDIFLGDTLGELRLFLAASDIAFIGGSLIERGGHNVLEPAAFAIPVLSGPHTFNFVEAVRLLTAANALITVHHSAEVADQVQQLINDKDAAKQMGERGYQVIAQNRGSLERHQELVASLMSMT